MIFPAISEIDSAAEIGDFALLNKWYKELPRAETQEQINFVNHLTNCLICNDYLLDDEDDTDDE